MTQEECRRIMIASAGRYGAPHRKSGASTHASPGGFGTDGSGRISPPVPCAIKVGSHHFAFAAQFFDFRGALGSHATDGAGVAGQSRSSADNFNPPVHEDASR